MMHTFKKGDYALIRLPMMKDGRVFPDAAVVVLVEKVNMIGIVQKYYLPMEPFSVKPHHLATVHPVPDQQKADQWFKSGKTYIPTMTDAARILGSDSSS